MVKLDVADTRPDTVSVSTDTNVGCSLTHQMFSDEPALTSVHAQRQDSSEETKNGPNVSQDLGRQTDYQVLKQFTFSNGFLSKAKTKTKSESSDLGLRKVKGMIAKKRETSKRKSWAVGTRDIRNFIHTQNPQILVHSGGQLGDSKSLGVPLGIEKRAVYEGRVNPEEPIESKPLVKYNS